MGHDALIPAGFMTGVQFMTEDKKKKNCKINKKITLLE